MAREYNWNVKNKASKGYEVRVWIYMNVCIHRIVVLEKFQNRKSLLNISI